MKSLFLGAALFAFAACSSSDDPMNPSDPTDPDNPDNPDNPDDPVDTARDYNELASVIGAHVRAEFAVQLATKELSNGRVPAGFSVTSSTLEEIRGVGSVGSMNFELAFYCHDTQIPHQLQACDGTADHSHFTLTATGAQSVGAMSMTQINRTANWMIRDLALGKARFIGPDDASMSTQVTTEGVSATYGLTYDATYDQVRYLAGQLIPTFGTISFAVTVERTRGSDVRSFVVNAVLTYAKDANTLVLDGSQNYALDINSGVVTKL